MNKCKDKERTKVQPMRMKGGSSPKRNMKRYIESQSGSMLLTNLLSPRKISRPGTWNVRTIYKICKAAQIKLNEIIKYGWTWRELQNIAIDWKS